MDPVEAEHRPRDADEGTPENEGQPDAREGGQQPIEGDLEPIGVDRHVQDPGSQLVGPEENGPHGERVGDPAHGDGNRHVAPDVDGYRGGDQHLEGNRDHRAEDPDGGGARGGPAVEPPEIAVVEKTAEEAHPGPRPDRPRLGEPAFEKAPQHSFVRWSPSENYRLSRGNRCPTIRVLDGLRPLAVAPPPAGGKPGRGRNGQAG